MTDIGFVGGMVCIVIYCILDHWLGLKGEGPDSSLSSTYGRPKSDICIPCYTDNHNACTGDCQCKLCSHTQNKIVLDH